MKSLLLIYRPHFFIRNPIQILILSSRLELSVRRPTSRRAVAFSPDLCLPQLCSPSPRCAAPDVQPAAARPSARLFLKPGKKGAAKGGHPTYTHTHTNARAVSGRCRYMPSASKTAQNQACLNTPGRKFKPIIKGEFQLGISGM